MNASLIRITGGVNSFGCNLLILIENVRVTGKSVKARKVSHTNIYLFSKFQVIEGWRVSYFSNSEPGKLRLTGL